MSMKKSYEDALAAVKKLRSEKLKRRGSTGMGMLTIEISENDLKSKTKVKKALSSAILKKIR
jgi:hypothetical protein